MFGIGLWEMLLVFGVILIAVKPEDLPSLLRSAGKAMRKVKHLSNEFTSTLNEISHDVSADEVQTILGDDGKHYDSYDVNNSVMPVDTPRDDSK